MPHLSFQAQWQLWAEKVVFRLKSYLFSVCTSHCTLHLREFQSWTGILRESVFAGQEPFQPKRYLFSVHSFYWELVLELESVLPILGIIFWPVWLKNLAAEKKS
jgi:hypothetical protein